MAAWEEKTRAARNDTARALTLALLRAAAAPPPSLPSPENARPDQRPFAMLWEVEKNGRVSWLGGTAHFFCYSFETSFIRLFRKVDNVLFEGPLDEDALIRVLKEPKDSIVKQYQALFRMDNVELEFTDEALRAVAKKTIERKSGARGLRSVVEGLLIPIMFEVPSDPTIIRVIVTPEAVEGDKPQLEYGAVRKRYKSTVPVV